MGVLSNKITRNALKPGDHIYSWRNAYLYSHHGIYAGEEKVIHFTRGPGQEIGTGTLFDRFIFSSSASFDHSRAPCQVCGNQTDFNGVISSCLDCFLWGGELYLFEYGVSPVLFLAKPRGGTCTLACSDPPEDAIHRASCLLQNGFGVYNTFKNNCEDFAIYCKTGLLVVTDNSLGRSGQATTIFAAVKAVVPYPLKFLTTSCSVLAAVHIGMYCVSRLASDVGVRRDVKKIPVEMFLDPCNLGQSTESAMCQMVPCDLDQPVEKPFDPCDLGQSTETATCKILPCNLDQPAAAEASKETAVEKLPDSCDSIQPVGTSNFKQD